MRRTSANGSRRVPAQVAPNGRFAVDSTFRFMPSAIAGTPASAGLPRVSTRGLSMLVVMQTHATEEQIRAVCQRIEPLGFKAHPIPGSTRTAIGITGNTGEVEIGGAAVALVAGPCAIEDREQALAIGKQVARTGVRLFRGGAYKPRTSPYSFQGMGEPGLKILAEVREQCGLGIVTEAVDNESLDLVERYADVIQIGARNMQNFSLLKRAGRARKPVLLKRGMSATLDEFLMAAEYILSEGNYNVMLCERGVRTFSDFSRNTLDLAVVPAVKRRSHLPIFVDPSHGT